MSALGDAASVRGMSETAEFPPDRRFRRALWRTLRGASSVVRRLLIGERSLEPLGWQPGETISADVVMHFPDAEAKLYQLTQWLPVLKELDKRHPVLILTRRKAAFVRLHEFTSLRKVYVPLFSQLSDLYTQNDFKVALYVNNGMRNFQSLAHQPMRHVHINHGESDKVSMVSNQAKAYDRVFIAGEAARLRHRSALLDFDESKLVAVGRPQLDLAPEPTIPPSDRRTVLYAPTWEGESEANNYTSVDVYGPAIVAAVLAMPSSRLIYKPHPRVPDSDNPPVAAGHTEIMEQIDSAARSDPTAGHLVQLEGDVLAVIPRCDIVITDVSSVGLDFLYLKTENPLFITDRRTDRTLLEREAPVSRCSYVIDQTTIGELATALPAPLTDDSLREERQRMRRFYFGDGEPGDSTERFIAAVDELVKERDALVARRLAMGQIHSYAPSDD